MEKRPELNKSTDSKMLLFIDNGGRRTGLERRQYTYSGYIPERRVLKDRRNGSDRRKKKITETSLAQTIGGRERRTSLLTSTISEL